jgi:hypothetical protein
MALDSILKRQVMMMIYSKRLNHQRQGQRRIKILKIRVVRLISHHQSLLDLGGLKLCKGLLIASEWP